jgi:hypothetical protein
MIMTLFIGNQLLVVSVQLKRPTNSSLFRLIIPFLVMVLVASPFKLSLFSYVFGSIKLSLPALRLLLGGCLEML